MAERSLHSGCSDSELNQSNVVAGLINKLIARSAQSLQMQRVLVCELGKAQICLHKDVALTDTALKLKFRMNRTTHLKTKAEKPTFCVRTDAPQINYGFVGRTVFEGAETLEFELCKASWRGSSQVVARCAVPFENVVDPFGEHELCRKDMHFELMDNASKAIATLSVEITFRTCSLGDAGGCEMLKSVKATDLTRSVGAKEAFVHVHEAEQARARLQTVFDSALAVIGSVPHGKVPQLDDMEKASDGDTISTACGSEDAARLQWPMSL